MEERRGGKGEKGKEERGQHKKNTSGKAEKDDSKMLYIDSF